MKFPITKIFHSIQGEGHFVGYPMTFVRLAGCSVLNCSIRNECDEAPWKTTRHMTAEEIVAEIQVMNRVGIVCITGGEPADHDLVKLVSALREPQTHRIHIETSGTKSIEGIPFDWITVSPKVAEYKQRQGHTLKVVVRPEWGDPVRAWDHVAGISDCTDFFHRYLQPLSGSDGRPVNLPQVIEMLTGGYRNSGARWALSTQAHKNWGVL